MKKGRLLLALGLSALAMTATLAFADSAEAADMHRLYNPNSGEHFYTANTGEKNHLVKVGWKSEGIGWIAPSSGNAVYRLYNKNAGDHHYTMNANEKNHLVKVGWKYEGIGWYSDAKKAVPLYRAYNPNAKAGSHNYTVNYAEQKNLLKHGWRNEGIAWYGIKKTTPAPTPKPVTKYTVTIKHVGSDGKTLKSASATVEKGKKYTAKSESFNGYTLKGNNSQTVTVNGNKTITFNYTKNPAPVTKHTVTIKHVGSDGKLLGNLTVSVDKGKSYTANAATYPGYTLKGEKTQTVKVDSDKTITFTYTKDPVAPTQFKVTINAMCDGKVIKTKTETVNKGTKYTAYAETIDGYELNEYNVKNVTIDKDTIITFDYKAVEKVDTFNLNIYVDGAFDQTIVKTIKKGESYQPATKNLGLDENVYDLYSAVTYPVKNWIGGKTYDYDFEVYTYKPLPDSEVQNYRNTMLKKVNELRAQNGLTPYEFSGALIHLAGIRSEELDTNFDHIRPDGTGFTTLLDEYTINYTGAGENIAFLYSRERNGNKLAEYIYSQWLGSAGHKANMLSSRFTNIGIGVYVNKNDVYSTQLFAY